MIGRLKSRRVGPIGLDIGTHCVKLIQFNGERNRVIDAVRWDLPASDGASAGDRWGQIASVAAPGPRSAKLPRPRGGDRNRRP